MTKDTYTVAAAPPPQVEGADDGELNYDDLKGKEVVVKIARQQEWEVGQTLLLIWKGTTADGRTLPPHVPTHELTAEDIFNGVTIKIANEHAKAVVGGSALVYYQVDYGENSTPLTLSITGRVAPSIPFAVPLLDEASGGAVSPDRVPEGGATARVKFQASMGLGARVSLTATFTSKEGNEVVENFPQTPFLDTNDLTFTLRKDYIKAVTDGTLKLQYTLDVVDGENAIPSEPLDLRVGYGIIPPELEGELRPSPGDPIKVIVPKYTGMVGDEIAISVELPHLNYRSSQKTPRKLEDLAFDIPSGIFISALSTSATVCYHVTRKVDVGNENTWNSLPLNTTIVGRGISMNPPSYLSFADTAPRYNLSYYGISAGSKVEVYWQAEDTPLRHTELTIEHDGDVYYVSVPKDWMTADKRKTVCGNYATIQNDGESRSFSPGAIFTP